MRQFFSKQTACFSAWLFFILLSIKVNPLLAQLHYPVFPGLSGDELFDKVVDSYKPLFLLPQAIGRDTLFGKIDNPKDSLTCIYTGYTIWLDPVLDPTQAAFQNNGPDAINTEHIYPQSLGASGITEGDLHNLFPSRADVNAARGNNPFADIPDNETQTWYYLNLKSSAKPLTNIDLYSEKKSDLFEPREDAKGNIARSMMYFYTMYRSQTDQANPTYFEKQRKTLCEWVRLDPVDEKEWNRTWKIAQFQDGKPNPFVLDCSLAERMYCREFGKTCATPVVEKSKVDNCIKLKIFPNPVSSEANISWESYEAGETLIEVVDILGRKELLLHDWKTAGIQELTWHNSHHLAPGLALIRFIHNSSSGSVSINERIVISR